MKKLTKKLLAVVLAGAMIFALTACGNDAKEENSTSGESEVSVAMALYN